jgi:hypothetical protein
MPAICGVLPGRVLAAALVEAAEAQESAAPAEAVERAAAVEWAWVWEAPEVGVAPAPVAVAEEVWEAQPVDLPARVAQRVVPVRKEPLRENG